MIAVGKCTKIRIVLGPVQCPRPRRMALRHRRRILSPGGLMFARSLVVVCLAACCAAPLRAQVVIPESAMENFDRANAQIEAAERALAAAKKELRQMRSAMQRAQASHEREIESTQREHEKEQQKLRRELERTQKALERQRKEVEIREAQQSEQEGQVRAAVAQELERAHEELATAVQALGDDAPKAARASLERSQNRVQGAINRASRSRSGNCSPPRRTIVNKATVLSVPTSPAIDVSVETCPACPDTPAVVCVPAAESAPCAAPATTPVAPVPLTTSTPIP